MELRIEDDEIIAQLHDTGVPFNPFEEAVVPDVHASIDDRPIGGLGVFLTKTLFPNPDYERTDGFNRITLRAPVKGRQLMANGSVWISARRRTATPLWSSPQAVSTAARPAVPGGSPQVDRRRQGVPGGGLREHRVHQQRGAPGPPAGGQATPGRRQEDRPLCHARPHAEVFKISGFSEILAIHPTRQDAINAG